jgi:hypothetical protein
MRPSRIISCQSHQAFGCNPDQRSVRVLGKVMAKRIIEKEH